MQTRLLIAYLLILLMVAGGAGVLWWNLYHSRERTYARERARRRQIDAARAARLEEKDRNG
jgi:hypothetical protein